MVLAVSALVWSGAWKRATWLVWHRGQLEGCQRASLERGATEAQATRYCACLSREIEGRWSVSEYRRQYERASRLLAEDGTYDRCSAGGPRPPAGSPTESEWRRRTWEPWHRFEVERCAGELKGGTTARLTTYCECLHAVIEPRWTLMDFRNQHDAAWRALTDEGTAGRCWASSESASTAAR
jgi:hypothetical protein